MATTALQTPSSAFLTPPISNTPMSNSTASSSSAGDLQSVIEEFEAYPFSDDADFKAGLPTVIAAIRGTKRSALQIDEMIARAQWFFFCRLKGLSIPFDQYAAAAHRRVEGGAPRSPKSRAARSRSPTPTSPGSPTSRKQDPLATLNTLAEAKRMMSMMGSPKQSEEGMSFAMLCKLISEGRANEVVMKQIPDTINDAPPSQATLPSRPKPWELPPTGQLPAIPSTTRSSPPAPAIATQMPSPPSSAPYSALNFAPYGLDATIAPSPHFTIDSPMSPFNLTPFNMASFNFTYDADSDSMQDEMNS